MTSTPAPPARLPAAKQVSSNGLNFNVIDEGKGDAVVLLHGFPNTAALWRLQIPPLVAAGYRAIAPDLRGFGQSDRPKEVSQYTLSELVNDVAGILDALGIECAHVVGHDWGGFVAWAFAGSHRKRTLSLVAMAVGHPGAIFAGPSGFAQKQALWYSLLFLFPGLADKGLLTGGKIFPQAAMSPQSGGFLIEDFHLLARPETEAQAAAVTAGLNYYRANLKPEAFMTETLIDLPPVSVNTLTIRASGDDLLLEEGVRNSAKFVQAPATFRFESVECPHHWPMWEGAEKVNALLLDFLKSNASAKL